MVKLRDIMTAPVVTFDPDISIREAAEVLVAEGVGGAPVMLHGELLGMVSASDLLDFMSSLPAEPDEVRRLGWLGLASQACRRQHADAGEERQSYRKTFHGQAF